MFKGAAVLCLFLCLLTAVPVHAEEEQTYLPSGEAEILLVHNETMTSAEEEDIEFISMAATSLNKSCDFGTPQQCADYVSKYKNIICYNLDDASLEFMEELDTSGASLMILGSTFMEQFWSYTGQKSYYITEENQGLTEEKQDLKEENQKLTQENQTLEEHPVKGKLYYAFSEENTFEELVEMKGLKAFLHGNYSSGEITAGNETIPFCSQVGNVRFIPVTAYSGKLVRAALMQEMVQWMWPYRDAPPDYAQYFVLDQVYPFMPAEKLKEKVDVLIESGIPFAISVMPISQNTEFPSMKQFCQVLSYAQANGGAVILNAPIIHQTEVEIDELYEKLTDMTTAYTNYGVYPLGLQVPLSWTNDEVYLKVLERYKTVFVYDDGKSSGFEIDSHQNVLFQNSHQLILPLIELDHTGTSYLKCYSSALYFNAGEDLEVLEQKLRNCKESSVPFKSLWDMSHSVWANDFSMDYENHILCINEEERVIEFHPEEFDEDFEYGRNALQRITVSLQNQNKVLMLLVAVIIVLFTLLILYARKRNKRNFFYDDNRE